MELYYNMPKPTKKEVEKKQSKQVWCVIHQFGGKVDFIGSKQDCLKRAKRESFNPKHPIYYAIPVDGMVIHNHEHKVTHEEIKHTKKTINVQKICKK